MKIHQTLPPPFDPAEGVTVVHPPGQGPGWWAGAPAGCVDPDSGNIFLTYRIRRPRGEPDDRGGRCILARSTDGVRFESIWTMTKSDLDSPSLERSDLVRLNDGTWALYISYVDGGTNEWRTDMILADRPDGFDPAGRKEVFLAQNIGMSAVKDPVIVSGENGCHMLLSCASPRGNIESVDHSTADAYDTGTILSHTGLASSRDGVDWKWEGVVLPALDDGAWDSYSARISSVIRIGHRWIGYYDGAYGVGNHYDETTGIVTSADLRSWDRLSPVGPVLEAPGNRCLRYTDILQRDHELLIYYEYGRPDGSHELRLNRLPADKHPDYHQ